MPVFNSSKPSLKLVEQAISLLAETHSGLRARIDGLHLSADGQLSLALIAHPDQFEADENLRQRLINELSELAGITKVSVVLTAETENKPKARSTRSEKLSSGNKQGLLKPEGVKHIIAIASAKGGVGKSTIAMNLAIACAQKGLKVGLMDADIYGPSLPLMMGIKEQKPEAGSDSKLLPIVKFGIATMSIGYIADPDVPMIWRAPVAISAITQMVKDVNWGALDILLLDTPPGTGDIQLTLAQRLSLSGAVIISTPQEMALADMRRGAVLFHKTHIPVLGIIENMAYFEDNQTGRRHYIFGQNGAKNSAREIGEPFIGEIPLIEALRLGADIGEPTVLHNAQCMQLFGELANIMLNNLSQNTLIKPPPELIFED